MTNEEMILEIKNQIGADAELSDIVIGSYLESAKAKVINRLYPFDQEAIKIPKKYERMVIEIAVYLIAKMGAEGQTAHSENGVNRTYASADVPDDMLREIIPFVGVM